MRSRSGTRTLSMKALASHPPWKESPQSGGSSKGITKPWTRRTRVPRPHQVVEERVIDPPLGVAECADATSDAGAMCVRCVLVHGRGPDSARRSCPLRAPSCDRSGLPSTWNAKFNTRPWVSWLVWNNL
jgi:hypothetical protein